MFATKPVLFLTHLLIVLHFRVILQKIHIHNIIFILQIINKLVCYNFIKTTYYNEISELYTIKFKNVF